MTITRPPRARAMPGHDRREMIVDAAVPLLLEFGNATTTKQIAEGAGIAEGTLFRAFGDKESIIAAAVERFLDPEPLRAELRAIDADLPLEQKVHDILFHLRARFTGVIGIMSAIGMTGRPGGRDARSDFTGVIAAVLAAESPRLRVGSDQTAQFIRLVAFASSLGPFSGTHTITTAELAELVVNGIARNG